MAEAGDYGWSKAGTVRDETARASSTVLLLREGEGGAPEVFMVKRHGNSRFMPGLWVFPGGKVDEEDAGSEILARIRGLEDARRRLESGMPVSTGAAGALYTAAVRELFEEAGVLLARRASGDPADDVSMLARWRELIDEGSASFASLLETEDLVIDTSRLTYVSHWITPSAERRRFDTRFFAARAPKGQVTHADQKETTAGTWAAADRFLESHAVGDLLLAPPTLHSLREVAAFPSIEAYLREMERRPAVPVLPKRVRSEDGEVLILLPWDPDYESAEGEGLRPDACHPMADPDAPSRFILRDGRLVSGTAR